MHRRRDDRHVRDAPRARAWTAHEVTVEAGITLHDLGEELRARGLAMENQGDVDPQTLAGAISTATHGTGAGFGNLSSQVVGVRLVTGDRRGAWTCATGDELRAARVSLGALGAISAVTLRCVPAFTIHRIDEPRPLDDVLAAPRRAGGLARPLGGVRDAVHAPGAHAHLGAHRPRARGRAAAPAAFMHDVVLENAVLGLFCRTGRALPRADPVAQPRARPG